MKLMLFWEDQPTTSMVFSHWLKPYHFCQSPLASWNPQVVDGSHFSAIVSSKKQDSRRSFKLTSQDVQDYQQIVAVHL